MSNVVILGIINLAFLILSLLIRNDAKKMLRTGTPEYEVLNSTRRLAESRAVISFSILIWLIFMVVKAVQYLFVLIF